MNQRYILLKDTPELKKGAILEKESNKYKILDLSHTKFDDQSHTYFTHKTVENNPNYFREVVPLYVPKELAEKVEKMIAKEAK